MDRKKTLINHRVINKYETLLDLSGAGVYEISVDSKTGYVSDSLKKLLGLSNISDELSIPDFLQLVSENNRKDVEKGLNDSLEGKKPFSNQFIIITDASNISVKMQGRIIKESEGEYLYLVISELQNAEVSENNLSGVQKFADILNYVPIPLLIIAEDGRVVHTNKALTDVTGYEHKDIPTINRWVKAAYGDDVEYHSEIISQFFQVTKYRSDGEFRFFTKDHKIKYLHFYTAPLGKDENGQKLVLSMAADVTGVREKDELIRHQADELKVLTDQLPHLIFVADENGKTYYTNDSWLKFTGIKDNKELIAKGTEIVHPNDLLKFNKYSEMSLSGAEPFNMDVRIKHYSGEFRWLNIRAVPVTDQKGEVLKWIGTGTDVHDKYIAEQKLLHKASEFISLVEMLDHHVWVINADGIPEYFNKAWYEYTGLNKEQTWKNRMQVIHPSQIEKVKYHVELAWKKKKPYEVSVKMRKHDGSYEWFLSKGQPVLDDKGELIKYVGTIVNIHTHRQLEEALKLEVSVLSEIIESIPQMAWTSDSEGNIDFYNKRWYEYTGQDPKDAMGWGWKNVYHAEDLENAMENLMQGLKSGKGYETEARILRNNDNAYRWHLIKATPVIEASGSIKYWITTATDINEQKMLEQNKGQFLNIASHELRTPLTTLMGYLQLMEYAIEENNYKDVEMFLNKSSGSSLRMNKLINDLLNLSSIDTGKIAQFYKEKLNLGDFVADVINNNRYLHPEKIYSLDVKSESQVNANPFRLEQVLDNLLSNVLKYAPSSPVHVEVKDINRDVQVVVSDEGEGIPVDKLEAIFDRFYRVKDNGTTSGLGVGLFISREIINEHGGRIWAESSEGQGARFIFTLPKA